MSVYQATKAGLERLTTSLHRELEPRGIRVSYVRAAAMTDADMTWNLNPATAARFAEEAARAGLNLRTRPVSEFASVTTVFRALVDLPSDLDVLGVSLTPRYADNGE